MERRLYATAAVFLVHLSFIHFQKDIVDNASYDENCVYR